MTSHRSPTPATPRDRPAATPHSDDDPTALATRLAGMVAHDVSNVLTAVLGNVELLEELTEEGLSSDDVALWRTCLSSITDVARRAERDTRTLRAFSRRHAASRDVIDPAGVLNAETPHLRACGASANVEVSVRIDPHLPAVNADPSQLAEVAHSLVRNGVDACHDGGHVDVVVSACAEGLTIAVVDSGTGLPADPDHLRQAFVTTRTAPGRRGIGLTIAHDTVEAAGGTVQMTSGTGEGTAVRVVWPPASGS